MAETKRIVLSGDRQEEHDACGSVTVKEEEEDEEDDCLDGRSDSEATRGPDASEEMDVSGSSSPRLDVKNSGDEDEEMEELEEEEQKFVPRRSARVKSKFVETVEGARCYSRIAAGLARYYGTRFQGSRTGSKTSPPIRGTNDLPIDLKQNLKQLKNFLKLAKARRWVYFEYFYSDIDYQLFFGPNDFSQCMTDSFPMVKQARLTLPEWKYIKRVIGKPRRLSQAFLHGERQTLERKRQRIREIQKGSTVVLGNDLQLPPKIPRPLTVGSKVFAKIHAPKEGVCVYAGTVNAVVEANYRVAFDKSIQAHIVADVDVMAEYAPDLVSVSFFLEKNKAAQPLPFRTSGLVNVVCSPVTIGADLSQADFDSIIGQGLQCKGLNSLVSREEKYGNYPVRVVSVLTRLHKLIERKRVLINMLRQKNTQAEHSFMRNNHYALDQESRLLYAKNISKIAIINENLTNCLDLVAEHVNNLLPHLSEVTLTSRPKTLRKLCLSRAAQIVKQTNTSSSYSSSSSANSHSGNGGTAVGSAINKESTPRPFSNRTAELITSFCALSLQLKALCQQPIRTGFDFCTVRDAVKEIKACIEEPVLPYFEDMVELCIRHIEVSACGEDPAITIR